MGCLDPPRLRGDPARPEDDRYNFRRLDQAALEQRIGEICRTRVRFGYRRVHVLLRRERWQINPKKTYRIYKELGMQLRNKTPKRRVKAKLRDDRAEAVGPNDVWATDFVLDQLTTGHKIGVLMAVDTFSRYVPVLDPRFSYRGQDVVETLERICGLVGYSKTIRVDQGPKTLTPAEGASGSASFKEQTSLKSRSFLGSRPPPRDS